MTSVEYVKVRAGLGSPQLIKVIVVLVQRVQLFTSFELVCRRDV